MPHISTFNVWTNFIKFVSGCDNQGNLKKKLGYWHDNIQKSLDINKWVHSHKSHLCIKSSTTKKWYIHKYESSIYGKSIFSITGVIKKEKMNYADYVPVDIEKNGNRRLYAKPRFLQKIQTLLKK
jgi:hypothetical protein